MMMPFLDVLVPFLFLFVLQHCSVVIEAAKDSHERCDEWADLGECKNNPNYMLVHCSNACERVNEQELASDEELNTIESFFDLSANDIDGKKVDFEQFRGKVTIMTNVASYCGYTESHYKSLVELWGQVQSHEDIEILAFPCNQFGKQEPGTAAEIKAFAKERSVQFRMMEKINVNGPETHIVYKYLKHKAGPKSIAWNFATYFIVGPDGEVFSRSGVLPTELKEPAFALLQKEEL